MDIKELAKNAALKHGEEMVKGLIKDFVRPVAEDYIMKSENKVDDVLLPFLGQLEDALVGLADAIHEEPKEEGVE